MPRLRKGTVKIQFASSMQMPYLIYQACMRTGVVSNTAYIQRAVAEALARDLDMPLADILANIPPNRGNAAHLFDPNDDRPRNQYKRVVRVGPANTNEEVR